MKLLILGGTSEARRLVTRLSDDNRYDITLSLAGRTENPRLLPVRTRTGGFGGVAGLSDWIRENRVDAVIDATHPFAAQISTNCVAACGDCNVPLGSLVRAPWLRQRDDNWIEVGGGREAAEALGAAPMRVFLSVGRLELSAFAVCPQHTYLVRTIDPLGDMVLPPRVTHIRDLGPFTFDDEVALLSQHKIETVVSKNSGGSATYAKIEAARALSIPVVMVARQEKPAGRVLDTIDAVVSWLDALGDAAHVRSDSERGA